VVVGARRAVVATSPRSPPLPSFSMALALMLCYATPEEIAAWDATGRPELDRAAIEVALDQAYAD